MDDGDRDSALSTSSSEDGRSRNSDFLSTTTTDLEENYYSPPIDDSALCTVEELEIAIDNVKAQVLETEGISDQRKKLVKRLIELRLKLQDVKDVTNDFTTSDDVRIVQNHQFLLQKQPLHLSAQYCDRCGGVVWTVLQNYYRCKGCSYQCHSKCLNLVVRSCQSLKVGIDTQYIHDICPEVGLPAQNYKCAECKIHFTLKSSFMEPRKCEYDGKYYCPLCHKNYTAKIPARILHNWDFEERKICEASRQFLTLMSRKPNINLQEVNLKLFGFVEELGAVKRIREEIMIMKEYFMTCREALNQKLLRLLQDKQHFVENSYMYSLQDLIHVKNDSLLKYLKDIENTFLKHIKECETCRGKGFICEICENDEPLFPFDHATHQCSSCRAMFHNSCFAKRESCPKCLRYSNRARSQKTQKLFE